MLWAPFFHIYQPPDQNLDILERIVNESYRPLISDWLANPGAKATININACLTELMVENKYLDVIFGLKKLLERKQIEITASAKYHPFLPILPRSEIIRQIELNEETNRQVFGSFYNPQGFFPPEMGYSREVGDVVREMGYEWIILDEIAYNGKVGQVEYDRLYRLSLRGDTFSSHERGDVAISPRHSGLLASLRGRSGSRISRLPSRQVDSGVTRFGRVPQNDDKSRLLRFARNDNLYVFFRERRMSNLIMAAMIRSPESLAEALGEEVNRNRYLITAMDAETFGHHRPGLDKMLSSLYQGKNYKLTTISELLECFKTVKELDPIACCWASNEKEIEEGKNFYLYYNPENKLHRLQKRLIDLAIKTIETGPAEARLARSYSPKAKTWTKLAPSPVSKSRFLLDRALSCNHMWWSNPDAWWSLEEIEKGAYNLLSAFNKSKTERRKQADLLYRQILDIAFFYQRSGLVRKLHEAKEKFKKIPFKNRAKQCEDEALIEILKEEEAKAIERKEYELAIRWRDSRYKLEKNLDIYDFVHIVDQMRAEGKMGRYMELAKKYREQYNKLTPGQPDK